MWYGQSNVNYFIIISLYLGMCEILEIVNPLLIRLRNEITHYTVVINNTNIVNILYVFRIIN